MIGHLERNRSQPIGRHGPDFRVILQDALIISPIYPVIFRLFYTWSNYQSSLRTVPDRIFTRHKGEPGLGAGDDRKRKGGNSLITTVAEKYQLVFACFQEGEGSLSLELLQRDTAGEGVIPKIAPEQPRILAGNTAGGINADPCVFPIRAALQNGFRTAALFVGAPIQKGGTVRYKEVTDKGGIFPKTVQSQLLFSYRDGGDLHRTFR